jgi:hypothetical protein
MQRLVTYTIKDQNASPICGATWDETFSNQNGPGCDIIQQGDGVTKDTGVLDNPPWDADRFWWSQGSAWDGASNICSWTQTIKVNGFTAGGNFWTNAIQFTQAPNISVTPQ